MKQVLLVGCGAEIGSVLLGMVQPTRDGFAIGAVLTNQVATDPKHPKLTPMDGLCARIVLAQPRLLDQVSVEGSSLVICGNQVPVFFGDMHFHTNLSFDAGLVGTTLDVHDGYRMARGEKVISNSGQPVQLIRPLDFLVVAGVMMSAHIAGRPLP